MVVAGCVSQKVVTGFQLFVIRRIYMALPGPSFGTVWVPFNGVGLEKRVSFAVRIVALDGIVLKLNFKAPLI